MNEKKEVIDFFISQGQLLSPAAVNKIISDGSQDLDTLFFDKTRFVLDPENIKSKNKVEIISNIESVLENVSVQDLTQLYNEKYNVIKNIIVNRAKRNFVSVSHILNDQRFGDFSIVGIIRSISDEEDRIMVEIEDATGSIKIAFSKTSSAEEVKVLAVDDVIGISGTIKDKIVFGEKIIYPDVPLRGSVKGYGRVCFMSDLYLDESPTKDLEKIFSWLSQSNVDYIFISGKINDVKALEKIISSRCSNKMIFVSASDNGTPSVAQKYELDNVTGLSSPSVIKINGVTILATEEFNLTMLKKRYINYKNMKGEKGIPFKEFILEQIPDIILFSGKPFIENYKSVTILNTGSLLTEFVPVIVNLETRNYGQIYPDKLK